MFCFLSVALDPFRHQPEDLSVQMHRPTLGIFATGDQSGLLEHLHVLGYGLQAHVVRLRQFADTRIRGGEPRHHVASSGVGQGRECLVELLRVILHRLLAFSVKPRISRVTYIVNHLVEYFSWPTLVGWASVRTWCGT